MVDPANQVALRNVTNEQIETVRGLIQTTVAKCLPRYRAAIDMIGLTTTETGFVVSASVEMPKTSQLRT